MKTSVLRFSLKHSVFSSTSMEQVVVSSESILHSPPCRFALTSTILPLGVGPGSGGVGSGGSPPQPPVQAAHVSKVYVYSQLPGRLTAVHELGVSGPSEPAVGQTKAIVNWRGDPSPHKLLEPLSRTSWIPFCPSGLAVAVHKQLSPVYCCVLEDTE